MEIKCENCNEINQTIAKYCSFCGFKMPIIESNLDINASKDSTADKSKDNKRGKTIKTILGFVVGFIVMFYFTQNLFKPSFDKTMMNAASELNKTCPVMVDSDTRLDNSVALPGNIFQYNYTLVNLEKSSADIEGLKNFIRPNVINTVKTTPEMKFIRDNNATVNYHYSDKKAQNLFTVSVKPEDYK
jgi:hypothetical protein